jgi:fido (protein-threonine AMPylation protein)
MVADYGESVPYTVKKDTSSSRKQREGYWEAAASLQAVDGLEPSGEARRMAGSYIDGDCSSAAFVERVEDYHGGRPGDADADPESREADLVAARIVRLLESSPFTLSPRTLLGIHSSLFADVFDRRWVGRFRSVNLAKEEPVLGGRTVQYADYASIQPTLEYDFEQERSRPKGDLSDPTEIRRFSRFIANMWQVHAFREGNTRTTAVFSELYLRSLGAQVDNAPFAGNGPLFRDALVRANFSDPLAGIDENLDFIASFYDSVVNGRPYPYSPSDLNVHGIRSVEDVAYREDFRLDLPTGGVEGLGKTAARAASLTGANGRTGSSASRL